MMSPERRIRIAIVGGGLGGACVANALAHMPHLDVQVYEAAAKFSERGAAVGIYGPFLNALEVLVPSFRESVLDKAGAVRMNETTLLIGSGSQAGEPVCRLPSPEGGRVVQREALLTALLALLPQAILHANKRLTSISTSNDGVELYFADGTNEMFHAVIGADGIFGSVRKHVLGAETPQHAATPAGFWDCRYLVPFEKARAKLGSHLYDGKDLCQYGWCGEGAFIMHDVLDNGETMQCIISAVEKDLPKERSRPVTREFLEETLGSWMHGPIAKSMVELIMEGKDMKAYSQWEHKTTPTYCNGNVCLMGDAAHATTPWQGSGFGMAMEDAAMLGALLDKVQAPSDIAYAFQAYDELRRPRGQNIIDSSRATGSIICCQGEAAGADIAGLGALLFGRWDFITNYDLREEIQFALVRVKEIQRAKEAA